MIFRSYFSKNNTLIQDNLTNNSQNPVTEISYGTINSRVSRLIFNINLDPIKEKITSGEIKESDITKHELVLYNTIRYIPELVGSSYRDEDTKRASSFQLEIFNIEEDWDEGNGYDFVYIDEQFPNLQQQASNWTFRKTGIEWSNEGAYASGVTGNTIITAQTFQDGSENLVLDITDYINAQLFSGSTGFTATTYGLGVKFKDEYEVLSTKYRQAVAFHIKDTNTFFEPYVETTINNPISDDRNHFFMDKDNELYLYTYQGNTPVNVTMSAVTIFDYQNNIVETITGSNITNVRQGVYKVSVNVDSDTYPDNVIFKDRWRYTLNSKVKSVDQKFYLINQENYYGVGLKNSINIDNYHFKVHGLLENDKIKRGEKRRIIVDVKEFYPTQDNNLPLDIQYRLFVNETNNNQIDVIPFTNLDRTVMGYEFTLDTSWMVPNIYNLEVKILKNQVFISKEILKFTILSDSIVSGNF